MKKNIWLDGMMGLVVGDALGVPVQFLKRWEVKNRPNGPVIGMEAGGTYNMPEGTWSDDSSMAIATLVSILKIGGINPLDIMRQFVKWDRGGEYTPFGKAFDQGCTCSQAIERFTKKEDTRTCGINGVYANGNGALMRILPVCLYYYDRQKKVCTSDNEAIEGIHLISGLTHNHIRGKMCCGIYYFMAKSIIDGVMSESKPAIIDLLQEGIDRGLRYYRQDIKNFTEMAYLGRLYHLFEFMDVPEEDIKSSGYVIDSIEAAVWCLITTDSYRECMLKAVNLGDDTDTVAAIAGGLAGLYYGYENIPKEWLDVIKKREWIEGLCQGMVTYEDITAKVVDVHSHMLPSVDDGAKSFDVTKQMIRMSYDEGCRHLFLTPHADYLNDEGSDIKNKLATIQRWIEAEHMNIQLHFGAEIYVDPDYGEDTESILEKLKAGQYPTLNGSKYVLIEFYLGGFVLDEVLPTVKALIAAGYTPVIAHAERYGSCYAALCELKELGCLLQMNICDLYYFTENETNRMTHLLLKEKMFDFIGTDAHGINRRPPKMKEYIDFLYRNYDRDYVDGILYRNAVARFGL